MKLSSIYGSKVKAVYEIFTDQYVRIEFSNGKTIMVDPDNLFDKDGNRLERDVALVQPD